MEAHSLCASIVRPDWRGRADLSTALIDALACLDGPLYTKRFACTLQGSNVLWPDLL
jgi:hypothetical protein